MGSTVISIFALLLGATCLNLGLGLQASLLGLRADMEGFPVLITGSIMAAYYLGFIVGSLWSPRLVQRVGHIRTFAALASLASAAALCHAVFLHPLWWLLFRGITGYCFAGLSMVAESWLNDRADNSNRGTLLATYMVSILGGTMGGQLLLNMAPPGGYDLFVLVSVVISLSLVPVALTTTPMPVQLVRRALPLSRLFGDTPLGVVGCFASGVMLGSYWSLGAVYGRGVGLNTYQVSLFMAFLVLGGILFQWPVGRLSDHLDRRLVITAQCLLLAAGGGSMVLGLAPRTGLPLFLFMGVMGGVMMPLYALSVAHVNDYLEREEFVPASATMLLIYGLGATSGPLLAAGLMYLEGPQGLFLLTLATGVATGLYSLYRLIRRPPAHAPEPFIPVPRTTPVAYQLDPRTPEPPEAGPTGTG